MSCIAQFTTHPPSASVFKSQLIQQPSSICVASQSISYTVINTASVQKILAWFGTPNVCTLYCFIKVCLCRLLICWRFAHFVDDVQDEPWRLNTIRRLMFRLAQTKVVIIFYQPKLQGNPSNLPIILASSLIPLLNGWHVMTNCRKKMFN